MLEFPLRSFKLSYTKNKSTTISISEKLTWKVQHWQTFKCDIKDKTEAQKSIQASVWIFFSFFSLFFENVPKLPPEAIHCTESQCNVIHNVLMIILHFALSGNPPASECKRLWQTLKCKSAADVTLQLCGQMMCTFVRHDTWSQLMGSGDLPANSSPSPLF